MIPVLEVLRSYDIGKITEVVPCAPDHMTLAYRVETPRDTYCLKRARGDSKFQAELHRFFIARGWAPVMVATRSGEHECVLDGARWSLSHFIESDPPFNWTQPEWSVEQTRAAGVALAKWQQFGTRFVHELGENVPEQCNLQEHGDEDTLPWVLNHGDYHPGNLLFRDNEVCAVLDYEYARMQSPLYDLGYAIVMFAGRWDPRHNGTIDDDLKQSLVDGFASEWAKSGVEADLRIAYHSRDQDKLRQYELVACNLLLEWANNESSDEDHQQHFLNRVREHTNKLLLHLNS
jgi:thiamine kinase-like enzyme